MSFKVSNVVMMVVMMMMVMMISFHVHLKAGASLA